VPRKGRARRFREARELKQGFDDGLFKEDEKKSLKDVWDPDAPAVAADDEVDDDEWDDEDEDEDDYDPLDH
jgi:hypothetical protein